MRVTLHVQVGSTEEGVYQRISDALSISHPYDTIVVGAGVYDEALTVSKPNVTIVAAPGADVTVGSVSCALTLENSEGVVRGFKFVQRGAGYCVKTCKSHGQPRVENCEIVGSVLISKQSDPVFSQCKVHDSNEGGFVVNGGAKGRIENCKVYNNRKDGLVIDNAEPLGKGCEFYDGRSSGIVIKNALPAILLQNNKVHNNQTGGIWILPGGESSLRGNEVYNNNACGILCVSCRAKIEGGEVHHNREDGIQVQMKGQ
jgi:parallel beta-helix repeat protein